MAFCIGGTSAYAADTSINGGDSQSVATMLEYKKSYVANFDGGNSQDWYTFTPTGGNGYYGFHAYIVNEVGDVFADIDTHKNESNSEKFKLTGSTKKLYIKMELIRQL